MAALEAVNERTEEVVLRDASVSDARRIVEIYSHHVLTGTSSFELTPPAVEEMELRMARIRARGLPWRILEIDGVVAGYAYAGPHNDREAYRQTIEDSVYLDPAWSGRGLGSTMLRDLIVRCSSLGYRQMIARIGDSGNLASRRLHERCGFREVGVLEGVGQKFGRWLDVVIMQRPLA